MKTSEWRERARARLKGTTVLPGSCDKTRGAETLSAAAGAQLALLVKRCSACAAPEKLQRALRARAREAKIQTEKGSAHKIRHCACLHQ